jgi:hypothetical protein
MSCIDLKCERLNEASDRAIFERRQVCRSRLREPNRLIREAASGDLLGLSERIRPKRSHE